MDISNDIRISKQQFDILVIGSGLAGLYAAHYGASFGSVALITTSTLEQSNSYWAQGGIAAALDPEDSTVHHREDTVTSGRGLCNGEAVGILVHEGLERVKDMIGFGMKFDSGRYGIELGLESGHSRRRILHAGGSSTGKAMADFLIKSVTSKPDVTIFENTTLIDLISDGSSCCGALVLEENADRTGAVLANSTILAIGGASSLYGRTTNPPTAIGDGIAIAWRAGAEITDMEFVQFHPTALYIEGKESFLISEALRGEGAHLINGKGRRFMPDYHELAELAPRDIVSRAIFHETTNSSQNHVYLTIKHLNPEFIKKRFPNIYAKCRELGIDITLDPIPVAPAAHYSIGGVRTGLMSETNVGGLFACGEVACNGVHGANRLASNSLLECMVFAKRAVDGVLNSALSTTETPKCVIEDLLNNRHPTEIEISTYLKLKSQLSNLMNHNVGIVRNASGLRRAVAEIDKIADFRGRLHGLLRKKLENMTTVCSLIAKAALTRTESRGVHMRDDFPEEKPWWKAHIIWRKDTDPFAEQLIEKC